VAAKDLRPGDLLQTAAGTYVQVTTVRAWTSPHQRAHNLTIDSPHTYYVIAGNTPILVHNCGEVPSVLYHYTDDVGQVSIRLSGRILPRGEGEGAIYLTPDAYASAAEAQSRLAMTRVRPTGYFEVPVSRIRNLRGPFPVREWPPGSGNGGGTEYYTTHPIDASDLRWIPLGS